MAEYGTPGRREAGEPADFEPGTLVDLFLRGLRDHVQEDAFYCRGEEGDWDCFSRRELGDRVRRIALGLRSLGHDRDERIAIVSETRLEWGLADYGLIMAGLVSVPVYPSLPASGMRHILADSGAVAAFVEDEKQLRKVGEIREELPELRRVYTLEPTDLEVPGLDVIDLEELERRGSDVPGETAAGYEEYARETEPGDLATLIYTSGTTGEPKGVMLTHANFYSNVLQSWRVLNIGPEDVVISWLPLAHVFERTAGHYIMWKAGVRVAYAESVETVARDMGEINPTLMTGVPRFYEKILERAVEAARESGGLKEAIFEWARSVGEERVDREQEGRPVGLLLRLKCALADRLVFRKLRSRVGGRLRYFVSGGAPLPPEVARFFTAAGIPVLEGYGLTEASPVVAVNPPEGIKIGSVGPPVPGTEVRIADDGELLCRGPQVMKGYYHLEEETREVLTEDGWLHTGDIASLDDDGYLRITDRKKELIVTSYGKNIAPAPVENAIRQSELVDHAVMIGDRRKFPVVLVVPAFPALRKWASAQGIEAEDDEELVADERVRVHIAQVVRERTEPFDEHEQPVEVLPLAAEFTVEGGELTPTMKVKRRVVEEEYAGEIDRLYEEADREHEEQEARER
mgnify:CR=1 FL=1